MKTNIKLIGLITSLLLMYSCQDFLNKEPLDQISPKVYFKTADQLAAYSIARYNFATNNGLGIGTFADDNNTDNQMSGSGSLYRWLPGDAKVVNSTDFFEDSFEEIRNANYFFEQVLPKYRAGEISGAEQDIEQYIGEMYFIRAWKYYSLLKTYGDFPIIKTTLLDQEAVLNKAVERKPRNLVARFIIEDLDSAIMLMQPQFSNKNRLSSTVAKLVKSRVALYEASWLTNYKGTPFVPGGTGWPGASAPYNKDFSIDIDAEIEYFLDQALSSSKEVADGITLITNTNVINPTTGNPISGWNPYFEMFAEIDMSKINEVLMWRSYSLDLNITHTVSSFILSGANYGLSKGMVDAFVMSDGLPIYASSTAKPYLGDATFTNQLTNRDLRLQLFLANPAELVNNSIQLKFRENNLSRIISNDEQTRDISGYFFRKGFSYNPDQYRASNAGNRYTTTGSIVFRGVEAHLNYIEAYYMKNGSIGGDAATYWRAIRSRAGIEPDFNITINATDMSKESTLTTGDWGGYSDGRYVDETMYNIRRERRIELMGEGMRWDDLKRWKALDQVKNYQIEGFNLWDARFASYVDDKGKSTLEEGVNISSSTLSKYVRPYQIKPNNSLYNGWTWTQALYLTPIPAKEILITSSGNNADGTPNLTSSPWYQNPYWPNEAGGIAIQ